MEDSLGLGLLALAALVLGIVALAKLSHLGASIEELKRRLSKLEGHDETPALQPIATKSAVPPPLPSYVTQQPKVATTTAAIPATVPAKSHQAFNWESILGVKLFAWIGGFAFFLGIVFFVKYAFDNNWITIAWSLFAFGLLVFGIRKSVRAVRFIGIALLLVAFAKLFLHDLNSLEQLYRIGAFITVAVIAIVASFVYQRFLLPRTKT
jgi:uncharacterized membrane protein